MLALLGSSKKAPKAPASDPALPDVADSDDDSVTETSDFDTAAENVYDAVLEKDAAGFALALKAAIMACKDSE